MVPCQLCTGELGAAMAGQCPKTQQTPQDTQKRWHMSIHTAIHTCTITLSHTQTRILILMIHNAQEIREQSAKRLYWAFRDDETKMLMTPPTPFSLVSPSTRAPGEIRLTAASHYVVVT